ncbi:universal stress protein [Sporomusa sp. KB1]|jgi:nucleotide-binding universal stress UspA family protein|uniref:universal stress protein n=1 Tax=Sporomusa sp. KB1 TaxID=943346 RepID=UPI0011A86E9D|nr:universal stress protein [Sporomusa sp. KB1]TWH46265.1 nucleotide-binding universal stress UspA family protein [Sporomusa sp. KB1]
MFKKILVPIDGSNRALLAAKYARILAEKFDSSVTLIHIIQNPAYIMPDTIIPSLLLKDLEASGKRILDKALEVFDDFDGRVNTLVEYGHPGIRIVDVTEERDYSLIVMGRRGLSDVKGLLLGSVSNHVLHHASCPTLIIKSNDEG